MDSSTPTTLAAELALLVTHLDAVEAGAESLNDFSSWFFMSSRLEEFDDGVEVAWGVESILYQWADFPHLLLSQEVVDACREEMATYWTP